MNIARRKSGAKVLLPKAVSTSIEKSPDSASFLIMSNFQFSLDFTAYQSSEMTSRKSKIPNY